LKEAEHAGVSRQIFNRGMQRMVKPCRPRHIQRG